MDGTYVTVVKTPIGEVKGKLSLVTTKTGLSGTIEAMGMKSSFSNGEVRGNECKFSGRIQTMMGNIEYSATGRINGNKITVTANTNMGNFEFHGNRI